MTAPELRRALEEGQVVSVLVGIGRTRTGRVVRVDAQRGCPCRVDIELVDGGHIHGVSAARISPTTEGAHA